MDRSNFDSRMIKLLIKTSGPHQLKLLTYFLISFDWSASLDFSETKFIFLKSAPKIIRKDKSVFQNVQECYVHKLACRIIDLMITFVEDRPQIQTLMSKPHNYTKILSLLGRGSCEFRGLVYMNRQVEYLADFLKSLVKYELQYSEVFDTSILANFATRLISVYYQFLIGVLAEFRKRVEKVGNQTLTLEFYYCYTEFRANTNMLSKLYTKWDFYFGGQNVSKIELMFLDSEQEVELDKSFFRLRKENSSIFLPTQIGSLE